MYVVVSYVGAFYEEWVSGFTRASYKLSSNAGMPILKVSAITSDKITIDSRTPLEDVFGSDGHVAGITFIRKKASRMYEVPSSEGTTFFVMPPETTCSLDIEPPLSNWTAGDFTTYSDLSGSSGTVAQNPLYYGNRVKTAVPAPYSFGEGHTTLEATISFDKSNVSGLENGTVFLEIKASSGSTITALNKLGGYSNLIGMCVRIIGTSYDTQFGSNPPTEDQKNSFLGYYEIVGAIENTSPAERFSCLKKCN